MDQKLLDVKGRAPPDLYKSRFTEKTYCSDPHKCIHPQEIDGTRNIIDKT
jgi:hypothetical protein